MLKAIKDISIIVHCLEAKIIGGCITGRIRVESGVMMHYTRFLDVGISSTRAIQRSSASSSGDVGDASLGSASSRGASIASHIGNAGTGIVMIMACHDIHVIVLQYGIEVWHEQVASCACAVERFMEHN